MKKIIASLVTLFVFFPLVHSQEKNEESDAIAWGYDYTLYAGLWVPTGNLALVGNHPFIGVKAGAIKKKLTIDLSINFKFINSPRTYDVLKDGMIYTTRHFFGGYIGVDGNYTLLHKGHYKLGLVGGFGYEGFDQLTQANNGVVVSIGSLNVNAGFAYKYFRANGRYLGTELKYNIISYNNSGGTDLTGNSITLSFLFGGVYVAAY